MTRIHSDFFVKSCVLFNSISQPNIRRLGNILPRNECNGIGWACRSTHTTPETPGGIDIDLAKRRRVKLSPELTLTHTRLAAITEIPIYLAYVLRSEETGSTSHLNVTFICPAIMITVAHTYDIWGYTRPDAMHQPFLIVVPKNLLGVLLFKYL